VSKETKKQNKFLSFATEYFSFTEKKTNWRQEIIGGLVTFLAMSYILVVNPTMLGDAGMPYGGVFMATAIIAGLGSIAMGLWAKLPLALAPGMGTNAFFTYVVVAQMGYSWQEALAAGIIAGVMFLIISLTGVRKMIMEAVPTNLRYAIGAGIGFFIAFIGLRNAGIIVPDAGTLVKLTDFSQPMVWLALFGIVLVFVLHALKFRFSIIVSIFTTAVIGIIFGSIFPKAGLPALPALADFNYKPLADLSITAKGFVEGFASANLWRWDLILVIISFTFVDMFDTMGTFMACAGPAGLIKEDGSMEGADRGLLVDSGATVIGSMLGTPVTTTYIESSAGIAAGARSGFAAIVVGLLFFLSILLFPVIQIFSHPAVTAMALVLVGVLMAQQLKNIEWENAGVAIFAFMTIIITVLTYSIANGIAFGFVFYTVMMLAQKKWKEVHPVMYVMSGVFIAYYILQAIF
jgi:AGZA family xanthine/uracil permease-like MFS transporter